MNEGAPMQSHTNEEVLQRTNMMQIELASLSGVDLTTWIMENSALFRDIVTNDPTLMDRYATDPRGVLEDIQRQITQNKLPKAA